MTSVHWNMVAALNEQGSCVIDDWKPVGNLPHSVRIDCDKIAVAMQEAGAEPYVWYLVEIDIEPDGTVVGVPTLDLAPVSACQGPMACCEPTGRIMASGVEMQHGSGWMIMEVAAKEARLEGTVDGRPWTQDDVDRIKLGMTEGEVCVPSDENWNSFAISSGFEQGTSSDFWGLPTLEKDLK